VKAVFRNATSGPLTKRLYSRRQNIWYKHGDGYDRAHRVYDRAVAELVNEYMRVRGITAGQMTTDQAHEVVRLIKQSSDPRIANFVKVIRVLERHFRMFGGRGYQ
jgi:hypothetical protein